MNKSQAREFIRHPSDIPLEVRPQGHHDQFNLQLNNVSVGGLSFDSPEPLHAGSLVKIKISRIKPVFRVNGIVQWCQSANDHYEVGVRFMDEHDAYRVRMIEQVCHIEQYRKYLQIKQGKRVTRNKASAEWIAKHASEFPSVS